MQTNRPAFSSVDEEQVSSFFERFVDRPGTQSAFVAANRAATWAALRAIRRLPRLTVRLGDGVQGRAIGAQLDRAPLRRVALGGATAVLGLPEDPDDYVRGSSGSRYALRKRSRTARERGVRVERVDDPARRRELCAVSEAYERANPREEFRLDAADNTDMLDHRHWFVAVLDGRPIVLAVLPADGEWAALRYLRTLEATEDATLARYLVMEEVVRALVPAGVRTIVVGLGPHRLGNGVRRFQRMTGFRIVRLRVRSARRAPLPAVVLARGAVAGRAALAGRRAA